MSNTNDGALPTELWDPESFKRLRERSEGAVLEWVIECVSQYLERIEPDQYAPFISFVIVARVLRDPDALEAQARILHLLRPSHDDQLLAIVMGLLLAKQALMDHKSSTSNTHWMHSLRMLSERTLFRQGGIEVVRDAFKSVLNRPA
jgi:hypothetical protein